MALTEIASVHIGTLHDALQKARTIAPTKGAGLDRAGGFHLTFGNDRLVVRASDLERTYWHELHADVSRQAVFRLPSELLGNFVAKLPMSSEQDRVRFLSDDAAPKQVIVKYKGTKLQLKSNVILGDSFPQFDDWDTSDMSDAQDLATKLDMVAWAVDDGGKLSGVHLDGERLIAMTTKYAAAVACPIELKGNPITALLGTLTGLLKLGTNIKMIADDKKMVLALDEVSQVTSSLVAAEYPAYAIAKLREMGNSYVEGFTVTRTRMIEALQRLLVVVRNERLPRAQMTVRAGSLHFELRADSGEIEDAAVVTDQEWVEEKTFTLQPLWVLEALNSFTCTNIKVRYGETLKPIAITDPTGEHEVWMLPMADVRGTV